MIGVGVKAARLFLVECYLHAADPREVAAAVEAVCAAAEGSATPAVLRCCLAVPGDDSYFCVFAAEGPEVVTLAFDRAGVSFERIVEAAAVPPARPAALSAFEPAGPG